jgi:hypothetical protein
LAPASLINILGGQNGFLTATLFLGGILLIDRRPVLAGVLFGLLTFKPQLGLVLPFALIALGAWRVIASAALTALALLVITFLLFGLEPWRQNYEITSTLMVQISQQTTGFGRHMLVSIYAAGRNSGFTSSIAMGLQALVALPVLAAACWAVRRTIDPCQRAMVLATAAPLVTPYYLSYDLTAASACVVWSLVGRLPWRDRWRIVYLFAWLTPTATVLLSFFGAGVMPLFLVGLFCIAVLNVRDTSSEEIPAAVLPAAGGNGRSAVAAI